MQGKNAKLAVRKHHISQAYRPCKRAERDLAAFGLSVIHFAKTSYGCSIPDGQVRCGG